MIILEIVLYIILAGLLLFLAYFLINICLKHSDLIRHDDFWFQYRFIPRRVKRPDLRKSQYYDRFPNKDGTQWTYAPTINDMFMLELVSDLERKIGKRSDSYKAGYILKMVQYGYRYHDDAKTYGTSEKWAFPVCTCAGHIGDCEDGALLGACLSKLMGLDVVMVSWTGHALYGVNCKGFGMRIEHEGKKYLLCETTSVLPKGITLASGSFKKAYDIKVPEADYIEKHTYEDAFSKYF